MNLSISNKLLLAFLGLTLIILVTTLGLARWSFERGFLDYINALEQKRLELIAEGLLEAYERHGNNWRFINQQSFGSMLRSNSPDPYLPSKRPHRGPDQPLRRRPPPRTPGYEPGPPTALFSASGQYLAGASEQRFSSEFLVYELIHNQSKIGELRSVPRRVFESTQETAFAQQQWIMSLLTGGTILILATIFSLLLTRVFIAPIKHLINGVKQLSNGQYDSRINASRGDELGQLMDDMDRLALTLEENQNSRQRWFANISHELRTPVTVLTGEIETMKDGIRPMNAEQLDSLDQEVRKIRHLIEDLYQLSLSDIGGLRYSFESVSPTDVLVGILPSFKKRSLENNLELQISLHSKKVVDADVQRLEQLFSNLLENSLSYTDSPGSMALSITDRDNWVQIIFEDSAPGIIPEECVQIFDPLYRNSASLERKASGAGLGLAICSNIVKAHQGKLSAAPSLLGGLKVTIELPVKQ